MEEINENYIKIVYKYLGEQSAKLYREFFSGFPLAEQREGLIELLEGLIGKDKLNELVKKEKI
ncbi:MAG: hypothetical protein ACMG57_00250 [Candidatus Dojkabacteria bacterium]